MTSRRTILRSAIGMAFAPLVWACGGGGDGTPSASPTAVGPQAFTISMTDAPSFNPASLTVSVGDTVTFFSTGSAPHTATCDIVKLPGVAALPERAAAWDSGMLQPGQRFNVRLTVAGTYTYACTEHAAQGMVGTIVVEG